jgi:hypothetical protein
MKIWQTVMTMRDESKQVQDAVHEAITKGWVPIAVNPLLDISYLVSATPYPCHPLLTSLLRRTS